MSFPDMQLPHTCASALALSGVLLNFCFPLYDVVVKTQNEKKYWEAGVFNIELINRMPFPKEYPSQYC